MSTLLYDTKHPPSVGLDSNNNDITDADISVVGSSNDNRLSLQLRRKGITKPLLDASYGSVYLTKSYSEIRHQFYKKNRFTFEKARPFIKELKYFFQSISSAM